MEEPSLSPQNSNQVCFRPYPYFQGILMKVNSVRYKWVRYSRVNAIHVNSTQTASRTVVNHFSWAARCSYCGVTSKISWLTMFPGRWVGWFFVKFNRLLKISLECTSYTNVMILLSVIFRLQWYQIQSSLKSINHLFKYSTYVLLNWKFELARLKFSA